MERAPFYLTCGSAVAILFGPGVSETLLALAFAALLISNQEIRFPPIKLPLFLFMGGTVIALLLSGSIREGTPQIRKFYLLLVLILVYSVFREVSEVRGLILILAGVTALSALRSLFQFLQKWREAQDLHRVFYDYYVGNRITGFVSHWMTLGGQEMIMLLLLASYLFFSCYGRWKTAGWIFAALIGVSLVLGETRSVYLLGFPLGLLYLLWFCSDPVRDHTIQSDTSARSVARREFSSFSFNSFAMRSSPETFRSERLAPRHGFEPWLTARTSSSCPNRPPLPIQRARESVSGSGVVAHLLC